MCSIFEATDWSSKYKGIGFSTYNLLKRYTLGVKNSFFGGMGFDLRFISDLPLQLNVTKNVLFKHDRSSGQ